MDTLHTQAQVSSLGNLLYCHNLESNPPMCRKNRVGHSWWWECIYSRWFSKKREGRHFGWIGTGPAAHKVTPQGTNTHVPAMDSPPPHLTIHPRHFIAFHTFSTFPILTRKLLTSTQLSRPLIPNLPPKTMHTPLPSLSLNHTSTVPHITTTGIHYIQTFGPVGSKGTVNDSLVRLRDATLFQHLVLVLNEELHSLDGGCRSLGDDGCHTTETKVLSEPQLPVLFLVGHCVCGRGEERERERGEMAVKSIQKGRAKGASPSPT